MNVWDRLRFAGFVGKHMAPLAVFPIGYTLVAWAVHEPVSWYLLAYLVGGMACGVLVGMAMMRGLFPGKLAGTLVQIRTEGRAMDKA